MNNKFLVLVAIGFGLLVTACTPPTYRKVTVMMVPSAFLDVDAMIAEDNGQIDLYLLPSGAVSQCKIENGSTISIQTFAGSPKGALESLGTDMERYSEELDKRFISFLARSKTPLNERTVTDILGCDLSAYRSK